MHFLKASVAIFLFCMATLIQAEISQDTQNTIKQNFKNSLPSLTIDTIRPSPIPNIYEVVSGPVVMYVTEDAKYAISGDILDLQDGETNITEQARKKARLEALSALGESHMIIYPAKKPKYTVTVFTDLDCVYCRKFHSQINQMNKLGITVRYVAFPRAGEKSTSHEKAVHVWCANDKKIKLSQAKQGQPVPKTVCENHKINEQFHLGVMMGVTGTPTLILQDGTMVPGYYAPDALLHMLKETNKQSG